MIKSEIINVKCVPHVSQYPNVYTHSFKGTINLIFNLLNLPTCLYLFNGKPHIAEIMEAELIE